MRFLRGRNRVFVYFVHEIRLLNVNNLDVWSKIKPGTSVIRIMKINLWLLL